MSQLRPEGLRYIEILAETRSKYSAFSNDRNASVGKIIAQTRDSRVTANTRYWGLPDSLSIRIGSDFASSKQSLTNFGSSQSLSGDT